MTDLTVLVAPTTLPSTRGIFGRRTSQISPRPIMVTLETELEPQGDGRASGEAPGQMEHPGGRPSRRGRGPRYDTALLSPPINTWKSPKPRPRHRPQRSQSAPPGDRTPKLQETFPEAKTRAKESPEILYNRPLARTPSPVRTSFASARGELVRPPPPLFRPTTFWRKTHRSGVTSASYSPSSHLVRRSTYIAAGLTFDAPVYDLSALGVESRVGILVIPPEHDILV
ncbi:hypothetical protein FA15DRAFT_706314 [Coprinopsis marcescibilis]|uniref:Uncharacterized protein n=1 Tax=Coprinopsis marcescibilis TaxID=230819 RepID=A0A5C3KQ42_COPMA|nr:hypothetical protein FA15DRAFT_706314 [Coprinopsis marcescibilis]